MSRNDTRNTYRSAFWYSDMKVNSTVSRIEQSGSIAVVIAAEFPQPGVQNAHRECSTAFKTEIAGEKAG